MAVQERRLSARVVIGAFEGPTPEQVRTVAEREGWSFPAFAEGPLAPFVGDGDALAIVRALSKRRV